jgi:hypothetical protein
MPKRKTSVVEDRDALKAWIGNKVAPAKRHEPLAADSYEMRAAIGDERARLAYVLRSKGRDVIVPNDDEPDHPGWRVVGVTTGDKETDLILNIVRGDQHWTDRPWPDKPYLTRGGIAGWGWFSGQVPTHAMSRMWRDILEQAGVRRHPLLKDC